MKPQTFEPEIILKNIEYVANSSISNARIVIECESSQSRHDFSIRCTMPQRLFPVFTIPGEILILIRGQNKRDIKSKNRKQQTARGCIKLKAISALARKLYKIDLNLQCLGYEIGSFGRNIAS